MISPILNVSKTDFERLEVLSNTIKNENKYHSTENLIR